MCNTYCFSTARVVAQTHLNVTLYVYCLSQEMCRGIMNNPVLGLSQGYGHEIGSSVKSEEAFRGRYGVKSFTEVFLVEC